MNQRLPPPGTSTPACRSSCSTYTCVYGHGLISQTDNAGTQTSFLTDGLDSAEARTDAAGTIVATTTYDVFGAVRSSSTGTAATEYRFTGQHYDADLGFIYLRARYYDPSTGWFISKDPFPGLLTLPASQHPYAYAHNNPVNRIDPSGRVSPLVAVAIGGSILAGGTVAALTDAALITVAVGGIALAATVIYDNREELAAAWDSCITTASNISTSAVDNILYHESEQRTIRHIAKKFGLPEYELGGQIEEFKQRYKLPPSVRLGRKIIWLIAEGREDEAQKLVEDGQLARKPIRPKPARGGHDDDY